MKKIILALLAVAAFAAAPQPVAHAQVAGDVLELIRTGTNAVKLPPITGAQWVAVPTANNALVFTSGSGTITIGTTAPSGLTLPGETLSGATTISGTATVTGVIKTGTAGTGYSLTRSGTATLSGGTVTVTDANVGAGAIFSLTPVGVTNAGNLGVTISAGTSFTIASTSGSDARVVQWRYSQ